MNVNASLAKGRAPMLLSRAILLYEDAMPFHADIAHTLAQMEESGENTNVGGRALASLHDIHMDEQTGRYVIGHGNPLARNRLEEVVTALAGNSGAARELLPSNLLFADSTRLIWWTPAQRRTIYFSTADKDFNRDVNGKAVAHPPLVLQATPRGFSAWALAQDARPDAATPLMIAPYCNLYEGGAMCRGDVKFPPTIAPSSIAAWEKIFYDSRFTHSNLSGKLTSHARGHNGLWRALVKAKRFDAKYLLPTTATVGDLLK